MIKPVNRLIDRVRSSHSVLLERGEKSRADTGCVSLSSFSFSLPPTPSLTLTISVRNVLILGIDSACQTRPDGLYFI